ncbi:fumarate reductase subunit D [Moritella sp. PE36]|nr:fumarate reductase subunit D [Moritella sp. PE36]
MAECTGLENQQGLIAPREFKSLLLRHLIREAGTYSFKFRLFAIWRAIPVLKITALKEG